MKKTASILAAFGAAALAILWLGGPGKSEDASETAPPEEAREAANTRSRPSRESASGSGEPASGSDSTIQSSDPTKALSEAISSLKEPDQALAIAEVLGSWTQTDPLAALAWIDGSDREDADDLRAHVLFTWAEKAPQATASWLEENPGMQEPANLLALLGPWMNSAPEAAVAWSTTKIETIQREGILADLLASCGTEENALALLGEVDPVVADQALEAAVTSLADEEPDLAGKLSGLITGPADPSDRKPEIDSASPTT
ncbi:MAG: hypothetical protein EOP87_11790, partial [Verrucomicrobiaceae bacterium]